MCSFWLLPSSVITLVEKVAQSMGGWVDGHWAALEVGEGVVSMSVRVDE